MLDRGVCMVGIAWLVACVAEDELVVSAKMYDADGLVTGTGCDGLFSADQLLAHALTMSDTDWRDVLNDRTFDLERPAWLACGDEAPLYVGVHRKRSGTLPKVAFSIDVNAYVSGQTWHGLKKVTFENGVSEGEVAKPVDIVGEYLSWRLMSLSGAMSARAALATLTINGEQRGVYTVVEGVDKTFLAARLGDKSGWLYKYSGSLDDGYRTNEDEPNPYEAWFAFMDGKKTKLPSTATLAAELPARLDIDQMLTVGAVNAIMGNADAPIFKPNNYYRYDGAGGRVYFPWDLDSSMTTGFDVFTGRKGASTQFTRVLFTNWEDDYDAILTGLVDGQLSEDVVAGELERIRTIGAAAIDADPFLDSLDGGADAEIDGLLAWWAARLPEVRAQVGAH